MIRPGSFPGTGTPFPLEEYQRRIDAVIDEFDAFGIDALAATSTTSQEYLTGYDGSGSYYAPFPFIVSPTRPPVYVVRAFDEDAVRSFSWIENVVPYSQEGDQARVWADVLSSMGLAKGRLGLELGAWGLSPRDLEAIRTRLPDMRIVDATRLVPSVAAIKSDLELEAMRAAMVTTDLAIETFQATIALGVSERETADAIESAVSAAGGEVRILSLLFGPRTALPHGRPSAYRIGPNQPAYVELGGEKNGYVAGLCRSAILGRHDEARRLHQVAEEGLAAVLASMRPGATAGEVDLAARKTFERAGRLDSFRHRTGYQHGIDWLGRGNLSLEPGSREMLRPRMTFHMALILYQRGEFALGCSQTVVITDDGAAPLSRTSPALYMVD
jgi:Xaa-Pro aminopeptidase